METSEILEDAFGRIRDLVDGICDGLDEDALAWRPDADGNSIGWLLWHLTRVQDDHVSEIAGREQAWVAGGWAERFGMEPDPSNTGYGHSSAEVGSVRPAGDSLRDITVRSQPVRASVWAIRAPSLPAPTTRTRSSGPIGTCS